MDIISFHLLKKKAMESFLPYQFSGTCPNGADKVACNLRQCIANHWMDGDVVLLEVTCNLSNVSRQSILNEYVTHFPKISALGFMVLQSVPFFMVLIYLTAGLHSSR